MIRLLIKIALSLAGLYGLVTIAINVAGDNQPGWIAVAVLIWLILALLGFAGPEGRNEAHTILEQPRDEREKSMRTRALGFSFAAVMLFCAGWFVFSIVDDRESLVPLLALLTGLLATTASVEFIRRRG